MGTTVADSFGEWRPNNAVIQRAVFSARTINHQFVTHSTAGR
jgi:hypothetical protein